MNKAELSNYFSSFFAYFYAKLNEPFRDQENSFFFQQLRVNFFFSQFLVDILLFGSLISEKVSGASV